MKNFIKENWKTFIVGIIALLVCIFGVIQFANKFEENELAKLHNQNHDKEIENRVKSEMEKIHIAEIDSLKQNNFHRIEKLTEEIINKSALVTKYKNSAYNAEKRAQKLAEIRPDCNEIVKPFQYTIDTLKLVVHELDSINEKLDNEAELYSTNWYETEKQRKILEQDNLRKDSANLELKRENFILIKKANSNPGYWKGFKDGYKWGFGSAVVIETGFFILLKR